MTHFELDPSFCAQAFEEALARFPQFAPYPAKLIGRPLYQGTGYQLQWTGAEPPPELPDAWEYQNAAVKAYRRIAGV